ncbi:unnamed protein product [Pylaiella littoralis]
MSQHVKAALVGVAVPLTLAYVVCATPCLALLRAVGRRPPATRADGLDSDLSGKVAIVTGANTGIGARTAFHLARMGAKVVMACRSTERGEAKRTKLEKELAALVAAKISGAVGAGTLEVMECDLCNLSSVRAFARAFTAKHGGQLDILVNNAGIGVNYGKSVTADGLEPIFGGNFVGHFLLTSELMPAILSAPAARVVCLSSIFHHVGTSTEWEAAACGSLRRWSYAESKLAMVLFAKELRRRFAAVGSSATAFAVNPGLVRSDIYRHVPKHVMVVYDLFMRLTFLTVDQGCCPSVCASAWPTDRLSESDYYQPYWMPFGYPWPFELMGPFVGCAPARPSLPEDEPASASALWTACERVVEAAGAAKGDAPGAARG